MDGGRRNDRLGRSGPGSGGAGSGEGVTGRLLDRVAIVTGTARGIGRAIAARYAAEGAIVIGIDIQAEAGADAAEAIRREIEGAGGPEGRCGTMHFVAGDVSNEEDVRRTVREVRETHGRIDILVNDAAVQIEALATDVRVEDFHRIVDVNLLGCVLTCREALPAMVDQGGGAIVNLSSVNAFSADPLLPVYGATKAAIIGYTKSVAVAFGPHGVRANAICPGDVDTELNRAFFEAHPDPVAFRTSVEREYPVRRIASTDEIARVAVFLASDDAAFINGEALVVDGGITSRIYEL
jgi:NAD(P)-dependent dehydrogenase (short-subunit alcohol dehydrogenase family)